MNEYIKPVDPTQPQPSVEEIYAKSAFREMGISGYSSLICPETGLGPQAVEVLGNELASQLTRLIEESALTGFSPNILDELFFLAPEVESKIKAAFPDTESDIIPEGVFYGEYNDILQEVEPVVQPEKVNRSIYAVHKSFMSSSEPLEASTSKNSIESNSVVHWSNQDAKSKVPRGPGRKDFKKTKGHGTIFSAQSSGLFSPPSPKR